MRLFRILAVVILSTVVGCSSNGWYGCQQPYPVGTYPGQGYPYAPPYTGYPGTFPQQVPVGTPTAANSPVIPPVGATPTIPAYGQPLPNGYPAGYAPGAIPGYGYTPPGVPLSQFNPNQPLLGR